MTDRTWELWWIVVDKLQQGRGIGKEMLEWVEADVTKQSGRLLLIETSSTPAYVPTRHFYLNAGYTITAEVTPYDGNSYGVKASRAVKILNSAPVASVTLISGDSNHSSRKSEAL